MQPPGVDIYNGMFDCLSLILKHEGEAAAISTDLPPLTHLLCHRRRRAVQGAASAAVERGAHDRDTGDLTPASLPTRLPVYPPTLFTSLHTLLVHTPVLFLTYSPVPTRLFSLASTN